MGHRPNLMMFMSTMKIVMMIIMLKHPMATLSAMPVGVLIMMLMIVLVVMEVVLTMTVAVDRLIRTSGKHYRCKNW